MTDCPNAEMRDRLPDVLHERLDASALAAVMGHVGECADCRAELALLREMRVSLSSGIVAVDSVAIARAVVTRTITAPPAAAPGWRWSDWRLAAAIALIAIGGASFAAFYATRRPNERRADTAYVADGTRRQAPSTTPAPAPPAVGMPHRVVAAPKAAPAGAELVAAGDVGDLSDSDLRTLLGDLDTIEAVPPTEPEPVTVRVSLPDRGGTR